MLERSVAKRRGQRRRDRYHEHGENNVAGREDRQVIRRLAGEQNVEISK
mgnify:FL=1